MSTVVSAETRRRWLTTGLGTAALVAVLALAPWVRATVGVAASTEDPASVVRRAVASGSVEYSATGRSRGGLALPDLSGFGDLAALLGGTTDTRVWWSGERQWRVDVVDALGERGTYGRATSVLTWDSERRLLTTTVGDPSVRLPRADDLLPPRAARRLLASLGPEDRLEARPARRVDGRAADVVRLVPGDPRSTVAHADVAVDRATGLPLRVEVVGTDGVPALVSELSDVRPGPPDAATLTPPSAPGARRQVEDAPDLVARVAARNPWLLPRELAGLEAAPSSLVDGVTTYGSGLVRVLVLPLPPRVAGQVIDDVTATGAAAEELGTGRVVRIGSGPFTALLAVGQDRRHVYVLTGLVTPDLLDDVAADLFADPPSARSLR